MPARVLRTLRTTSMISPMLSSSPGNTRDGSAAGQSEIMMDSPAPSISVYISSVIKGIKGCSSLRAFMRT